MTGAPLRGRKQDPELVRRRIAHRIGRPLPPETRARIAAALTGTVHDKEFRERVSIRFKGKPLSPEHRAKIAAANTGKKFSAEHRRRLSIARSGPGSSWWKGGVAEQMRGTYRYRKWREAVHAASNSTCQMCGRGPLTRTERVADHIKPWAKYPELRFDISNGQTLCRECNVKSPTYGARSWVREFLAERAADRAS